MLVFLAFARDDSDLVAALEDRLRTAAHVVLKDRPAATSNPFWRQAILPELRRADVTVVIWSYHAAASPWLDQEIRGVPGRRLWLLVDSAAQPAYAAGECAAATADDILSMLGGTRVAGIAPGLPPHSVQAGWRRHEHVDAGIALVETVAGTTPRWPPLVEIRDGTLRDDEQDVTYVRISGDAYVATTAVTVEQYQRFAAAAHLPVPSGCRGIAADSPVVGVTWFEAVACSRWFGGTVPSEDHWQRAASANGTRQYATATGGISHALAWYGVPFGEGAPVPQRSYSSTPDGFFGMCGNTWDWCGDSWGPHRVIRGGCWMDAERFCTATARYRNAPVDRDIAVGVRVQIHAHKRKDGRYELDPGDLPPLTG
jgi:formylglycine-generating enzyme required for sulfatase activity